MRMNKRHGIAEEARAMGPIRPGKPNPTNYPNAPWFFSEPPGDPLSVPSPKERDDDGDGIPNYQDPDSPYGPTDLPPDYINPVGPFPYGLPFPYRPGLDPFAPGQPLAPKYAGVEGEQSGGGAGDLPPLDPFATPYSPMPYPGFPYLPKPYSTPDDAPFGTPSRPFPNTPPLDPFAPSPDYPFDHNNPLAPHYKRSPIPGQIPIFTNDPLRGRKAGVEGEYFKPIPSGEPVEFEPAPTVRRPAIGKFKAGPKDILDVLKDRLTISPTDILRRPVGDIRPAPGVKGIGRPAVDLVLNPLPTERPVQIPPTPTGPYAGVEGEMSDGGNLPPIFTPDFPTNFPERPPVEIPFRPDFGDDEEPALPDDGPPPGAIPVTDPALEPFDLNGDGYIDTEEQIAAMDNDSFLFIILRMGGMPASLRRVIRELLDGEMPSLGNLRRLLRWLEKNPEYYPMAKRLLPDDIPWWARPLLPPELK